MARALAQKIAIRASEHFVMPFGFPAAKSWPDVESDSLEARAFYVSYRVYRDDIPVRRASLSLRELVPCIVCRERVVIFVYHQCPFCGHLKALNRYEWECADAHYSDTGFMPMWLSVQYMQDRRMWEH